MSVFEAALRDGVQFAVTGWGCLMSAYTEHGMLDETQAALERITAAGMQPDEVTFTVLLSCAAKMKSLSTTQRIHQHLMAHPIAKRDNVLTAPYFLRAGGHCVISIKVDLNFFELLRHTRP